MRARERVWTDEAITSALKAWRARHGRWPTTADWRLAEPGEHPSASTVSIYFGRWHVALAAAGYRRAPYQRVKPNGGHPRVFHCRADA